MTETKPPPHGPASADELASRRPRGRVRGALRTIVRGIATVVAVYLVGRGIVEPFLINPFQPETYRHDWGGPHYLGVLLVHSGPGVVIVIIALRRRWRRHRHPGTPAMR
jgi:hypothetical protein